MTSESRCGINGSARPGATECDVVMKLSCRRLRNGTCPRAGQLPPESTISLAFPPTAGTTLYLLKGNIEAEKAKCPNSQ